MDAKPVKQNLNMIQYHQTTLIDAAVHVASGRGACLMLSNWYTFWLITPYIFVKLVLTVIKSL